MSVLFNSAVCHFRSASIHTARSPLGAIFADTNNISAMHDINSPSHRSPSEGHGSLLMRLGAH